MKEARSGLPLFTPVSEVGKLPREVKKNLPENYGIRVTRPQTFVPTSYNPRLGYAPGFGQHGWLLAADSVVECIDNFEKCRADETGELSKHDNGNDIFFVNESNKVGLYLMRWVDSRLNKSRWDDDYNRGRTGKNQLIDVSITTGVVDQFIVGDFVNIGVTGPFSANDRYIHGKCSHPRKRGWANVVIETNQ